MLVTSRGPARTCLIELPGHIQLSQSEEAAADGWIERRFRGLIRLGSVPFPQGLMESKFVLDAAYAS